MPSNQLLRVGVVGCSGIAQMMHLPFLRSLPELFKIQAISDLSPKLLTVIGELYGVPPERQFMSFEDLVAQDLDVVIVLSGGTHAPPVLAAIKSSKHVLVEKPLCFTLREAREIAEAAEIAKVKVMVAYMKRYDPGYLTTQRLFQVMGEVRYVQINTLHPAEDDYLAIHGIMRFNDIPADVLAHLSTAQEALYDEGSWSYHPGILTRRI